MGSRAGVCGLCGLLCWAGCGGERVEPPQVEGYVEGVRWEVVARADAPSREARALMLRPGGMALLEDGEGGGSLWVAEVAGGRVVEVPIGSQGGAPSAGERATLAGLDLGGGEGAWVPSVPGLGGQEGEFGGLLARGPSGELYLTGAEGELWVVPWGASEATRVGAGEGGAAPAEGLSLGEVELRPSALAVDPEGSLLFAVGDVVYSVSLAGVPDGSGALRRVLGSGATGEPRDGQAARSAALRLGLRPGLAVLDGDLYVLEQGHGLILGVEGYAGAGAKVRRLAGGGSLVGETTEPTSAYLEFLFPALGAKRGSEGVSVFFLGQTALYRLRLPGGAGEPEGATLEPWAGRMRDVFGLAPLGAGVVVGNGEEGGLRWYAGPGAEPLALTGGAWPEQQAQDPAAPLAALLPTVGRPGPVVRHEVGGEPQVLALDLATGKGWVVGDGRIFAQRSEGTGFAPFRSVASVPAAGGVGPLVLLNDRSQVLFLQPESGSFAPASRAGSAVGLARTRLASWRPQREPRLLGVLGDGPRVWDEDGGAVMSLAGELGPGMEWKAVTGLGRRLPLEEPIGVSVVGLEGAWVSLEGSTLWAALEDEQRGGLLVRVDGRAEVALGGGSSPLREGVGAREVGVRGVLSASSGEASGDLLWWSQREEEGTALWRVGLDGLARRPEAAAQAEGEVGLRELRAQGAGRLVSLPCLGGGQRLLVSEQEAWWVNLSPNEAASVGGLGVGAGRARRVSQAGVRGASCLPGGRVGLLSGDGGAWAVLGSGEVLETGRELLGAALHSDGQTLLALVREPGRGAAALARAAWVEGGAPAWEVISGESPLAWEGRTLDAARLADDGAVFAGGPDGGLYGGLPGLLFRVKPQATGFNRLSELEVLHSGAPLGVGLEDGPSALAVGGSAERPVVFVGAGGRVWRFVEGGQGLAWVAGGGAQRPGLGVGPREVDLGRVEGVVVDPRGFLWLRAGGQVLKVGPGEVAMPALGGGSLPVGEAEHPWEVFLSERVGVHPALALDPRGGLVTPEPSQGALLRVEVP